MKRILAIALSLSILLGSLPFIFSATAAAAPKAYAGAKSLKLEFRNGWDSPKVDIVTEGNHALPEKGKRKVTVSLAYRLEDSSSSSSVKVKPNVVIKTGTETAATLVSGASAIVTKDGWTVFKGVYEYLPDSNDTDYKFMYMTIGNPGDGNKYYIDNISVTDADGVTLYTETFEDWQANTNSYDHGIHRGQWGDADGQITMSLAELGESELKDAYSGTKALSVSEYTGNWEMTKIDIPGLTGKAIPEDKKFTVRIAMAYRLSGDSTVNTSYIKPDLKITTASLWEKEVGTSTIKATLSKTGWTYYVADYTYDFTGSSDTKIDSAYIRTGSLGDDYNKAILYIDSIKVSDTASTVYYEQDFEDFTPDTTEDQLLAKGIHDGEWNNHYTKLTIVDATESNEPPEIVKSGKNALKVYALMHNWDTVKVDIKDLMGKDVPQDRKVKLNVKISYLLEASEEKNISVSPTVNLSTDAISAKAFTFANTVKASTKKWVTFSGDIECDLTQTTGDKIQWAYITLFNIGTTDTTVYVDDIKVTDSAGTLLDQGFEGFAATSTTQQLINGGIQTQWGGGPDNECSYAIVTTETDTDPKPPEKPENPSIVHSGNNSLLVYNMVNNWDTAKIDIKGLMGKTLPASRKLNLKIDISYLLQASYEAKDYLAPKLYISTDGQSVKEFSFKTSAEASTAKWATFSEEITCDLSSTTGNTIVWAYITLFKVNTTDTNVYVDDIKVELDKQEIFKEGFEDLSVKSTQGEIRAAGIQTQWGGGPDKECSFKIVSIKPLDPDPDDNLPAPSIVHKGTKALMVYDLVNGWDTVKFDINKLMGSKVPSNKKLTLEVEIAYLLKADTVENINLAPTVHLSTDAKKVFSFEFDRSQYVKATTKKWVVFKGKITCDMSKMKGDKIQWAYMTLFKTNNNAIDVFIDDIVVKHNGTVVASQDFEKLQPSSSIGVLKSNGIQTQWGGGPDKECSYRIVSTVKEVLKLPDIATGWKGEAAKGTRALRVYNRVEEYVAPMFNIRRAKLEGYKVKKGDVFTFDVKIAYKMGDKAKAAENFGPTIQINYADGTNQQFWSTVVGGVKTEAKGGWMFWEGKISCDFTNAQWQTNDSRSVPVGSEISKVIVKLFGGTYNAGTTDVYVDEISIKYKGEEMCPYGSFEMLVNSQLNTAGFFFEWGGIGELEIVEGMGAVASDRDGKKYRYTADDFLMDTNNSTDNSYMGGTTDYGTADNPQASQEVSVDKSGLSVVEIIVLVFDIILAVGLLGFAALLILKKKRSKG